MDKSIEEEGEDLYSDLPNFKYDETIDKLQEVNKGLRSRVTHLENEFQNQTKELEQCRSQCEILTKNISSLLKTAQNEIKRKDQKISELNKTVLELKTEVLQSRKRVYNGFCEESKPPCDEEKMLKRQKLQTEPEVPVSNSMPRSVEKMTDDAELPEHNVTKQVAPEIKCHTLYSQRMYNKIYNIDAKDIASSPSSGIVDRSDEIRTNNEVVEKKNNLNIKAIVQPTLPGEGEHHDTNILHITTKTSESYKIDVNMVNSKLSLNDSKSNHNKMISNSQKPFQNDCNSKNNKPKVLSSNCDYTEISRDEVIPQNKIKPLLRDRTFNSSDGDEVLQKPNCVEEKQVIISRVNRSVNFSRAENISQAVHVQHYSESSAVLSSIVSKKKITTAINADISNKINASNDITEKKVNSTKIFETEESEKFLSTKSRLRKAKKPTKTIITPISKPAVAMSKPISDNEVKKVHCDKNKTINKNEKEKLDIMEALFGSPLKWTENSMDDLKQAAKLSPPANAFEDSCSAQFRVETCVEHKSKTELSLTKHFNYTEKKCSFQPSIGSGLKNEQPSFHNKEISDVDLSKDSVSQPSSIHWPFSKTNNEIPSKNRAVTSPTFATFVNTESTSEACDVPSTLIGDSGEAANVPVKFLKSAKYNDSVLGQFDDTTQLINALAKDPSKLSPIHTPVKEAKLQNIDTATLHAEKSDPDIGDKELSVFTASPAPSDDIISLAIPVIPSSPNLSATTSEKTTPVSNSTSDKKGKSPFQTSPLEKKVSTIPASLILTVQKKLSMPTTVSPSVEKKFEKKLEKKTILLDKPINILCPRKTPRQIGKPKQSVTSKKQNQLISTPDKKTDDKTVQNRHNEIKSPSPVNEKIFKKESCSVKVISSPFVTKNLQSDESLKKCHSIDSTVKMHIMSSDEKSRTSKSPSHSSHKPYRETVNKDKVIDVRHKISSPRTLTRKEYSPIRTKSHRPPSRKETPSKRMEPRSPSRKENSPLRYKRPSRRDFNPEVFIRPQPRRESFRKPNCHFRQSSVDRKIAKDYRHYSKSRTIIPPRTNKVVETSRFSSRACDNQLNSKDRLVSSQNSKIPVILRSSRISWSDTNAKTLTVSVSSNDNEIRSPSPSPSPPMKWVLRPIDFGQNPNTPKESIYKQCALENLRKLFRTPVKKLSPSKEGTFVSVNPSPSRDRTFISPNPSPSRENSLVSPDPSPGKPIVIVAKRRPIKFGSNN